MDPQDLQMLLDSPKRALARQAVIHEKLYVRMQKWELIN